MAAAKGVHNSEVFILEYPLVDNALTAQAFLALRASAGWIGATEQQVQKGIDNCLFTVAAIKDDQIIGMGRLVGDGFLIWYIQDVIVLPEYQGKGIGKAIMKHLIAYIEANSLPNTTVTVGLMSAKDKEAFYEKLGFRVRPNEKEGAGMVMNIPVKGTP